MAIQALAIQNLRFRYPGAAGGDGAGAADGEGGWVLEVERLELDHGEQMLLTATSGGGKSTLLQLIAGLLEPEPAYRDSIRIERTAIHSLWGPMRDTFRGRHIGMIFQTFNLLHGFTALENVLAALMFSSIRARDRRPRAEELLSRLGIDRPRAMVDELSVGQQQRVAVARAVACDPVLVLADEPTASLDPDNAAAAMDLIQDLCREKQAALLCTSHDPAMRERFARTSSLAELKGKSFAAASMP